MQSNHNDILHLHGPLAVQSYLNFSKNAIKSQLSSSIRFSPLCSKLPQFFKECNQITTCMINTATVIMFKVTSIFQRMQSNHNLCRIEIVAVLVQSYLNFSKNAIKSQLRGCSPIGAKRSKLPQFFKECNQITTKRLLLTLGILFKVTSIFQRMQSNHNRQNRNAYCWVVQSYLNFSKNAIKSQRTSKIG